MAAVEEGIEVLGAETKKTLSVHERMALNLFLSTRGLEMVHEGKEVSTFLQVQKDGQVFHSGTEYTMVTARNSFTIKFKNPIIVSVIISHMARYFGTYREELS